ncbi:hypothetical protein HHK36_009115 [Tetracentron sinense]|uniref:E3 ubiquitin-protein ligase CHFR cysteine rich domain-containing protein n=1 Tax=Tetracentron sinense TaxID=13715 RepID=A0A835DI19_TETSI|nr:hypothetical protein HHK36_009115 [Tetracentron sinense]
MEHGESSGTKPSDEVWAKLVPSDSRYSNVEIRSNEMVICSDITCSSLNKNEWCKITKNPDLCSATVQNTSSSTIIVDGTVLQKEDIMVVNCGSEIISGPNREEYLSYEFKLVPAQEYCKKHLKISVDIEHAKCCICLNIWHDVVTAAPCLHNFCSGCPSKPGDGDDVDHLAQISEHTISRIPFSAHENNRHEQDITERCISRTGKTLKDVISEWIVKLNNREVDRARMPLNHAEMITAGTHLCK